MSDYRLVIIGGGLSGLAAGIRYARFGRKVLILESHVIPGGLNSYYRRQGILFETGLHAMTNYARPDDRRAPLNRLFRQLKLSRKRFLTHEQIVSEILFPNGVNLLFSNDFNLLKDEISAKFPRIIDRFLRLVQAVRDYDPFIPCEWISARERIKDILGPPPAGGDPAEDEFFVNMLLWPLMMYGNSQEHDMDFSQFVIMFRSIFLEGFFRPEGTIKDFLDMLMEHYLSLGGEIRFKSEVESIYSRGDSVHGVRLRSGEEITCDDIISTIGYPGTLRLLGPAVVEDGARYEGRISFMELICLVSMEARAHLKKSDRTIIFYNLDDQFKFCRPDDPINIHSGVICFPDNFQGLQGTARFQGKDVFQVRFTHPANYDHWRNVSPDEYKEMKIVWGEKSGQETAKIIGNYLENVVYQDSFTPITIEKFTAKSKGAVYGSPVKIKDGRTSFKNLFIAGTDQGFLGIVGSMLSGISMVNQHVLEKI
ncbi:MAG: NAD(P)/FAD-dependent oxidoreductase [Desulfobulbaceae bacterium]|nr:NAD(P)/FAD-dependent oxidoreductase [Desulfobulbaceae bacterium]